MKIGLAVERDAGKSRKHSVFQWFWRAPSPNLILEHAKTMERCAFQNSHQHVIKVSSTFLFLVSKSKHAQIGTERRFQSPSTSIRDFLVRGGTKSSQGPKVCEGYENRPETLPNKSGDKAA